MSKLEFITLCMQHLIDPAIALENVEIVKALKERNCQRVEQLLQEQF